MNAMEMIWRCMDRQPVMPSGTVADGVNGEILYEVGRRTRSEGWDHFDIPRLQSATSASRFNSPELSFLPGNPIFWIKEESWI